MPAYFKHHSTNATRALQLYLVLIALAARRQTITYLELSQIMEFGVGPILAHPLARLQEWCAREGLPPLQTLVVEKDTGLPSNGCAIAAKDVPAAHAWVFAYPWYSLFPPSEVDLGAKSAQPKRAA